MINAVNIKATVRNESTAQSVLRNGQIVQGAILKIYPQNKAEIQVGAHKMVAEVTTPLNIGEKYFFKVEHTTNQVQLKVIGEPLKADNHQNITALMERLGLKVSKQNQEFVQALVNEKIPFDGPQLARAVELLNGETNKQVAMHVLKEMISSKLPMTENVLRALMARDTSTMNQLASELITALKQLTAPTDSQTKLLHLLEHLINKPPEGQAAVLAQIMSQINGSQEQLVNLLKLIGVVDIAMTNDTALTSDKMASFLQSPSGMNGVLTQLTDHQQQLQGTTLKIMGIYHPIHTGTLTNQEFAAMRVMIENQLMPLLPAETENVLTNLLTSNSPSNQAAVLQLLQTLQTEETYQVAASIMKNGSNQGSTSTPIQAQFLQQISQSIQSTGMLDEFNLKANIMQSNQIGNIAGNFIENQITVQSEASAMLTKWASVLSGGHVLSAEELTGLKQEISERIVPHVSQQQGQVLMKNLQVANQVSIQHVLQGLANPATYEYASQLMVQNNQMNMMHLPLDIRHTLQLIGLPFEQLLQQNSHENQPETIKSLLLEMVQQGDKVAGARGQQLVHFIHGLQIQSVQETPNLLHAQIQIPAEKLGLNKDLFMQFEGRKTENGKINADYCRILFVLDLKRLKETIIDMHVQKRVVTVTVFNDANQLEQSVLHPLSGPLAEGLQALNYQLSAVKWEPLHEQVISPVTREQSTSPEETTKERFDFRI